MRAGDIIEFKRKGFVAGVLGWLLKGFERDWNGWGWHLAIVVEYHIGRGWLILEAVGEGVCLSRLDEKREYRVWRWLDKPVRPIRVREFMADRIGCKYDVAVYFWTMLQYLVLHYFNHSIPRLLDNRYTCWELVFEFCRVFGQPIQSLHKYPLISDFIREVVNH